MQIQHTHRDHDQTRSTRSPWTKKKRKEEEHFLNASTEREEKRRIASQVHWRLACLLAWLPACHLCVHHQRRKGGGSRQPGHAFWISGVLRWSCPRRWQIRSRIPMTIPSWMSRILACRREKKPLSRKFSQLGHTDCPGTLVRYDPAECVTLTFLLTYYRLRRFGPVWISTYAGGTFSSLSRAQAFFPFLFSSGEISPKSEITK